MERTQKFFSWLTKNWVSLISGFALAGACTITFVNMIVRRFFTNFVIIGGEELTTLFICWTVFVGSAQAYKEKMLFGIDVFLNLMRPKLRNAVGILIDIIVLVVSGYVSYLGWTLANSAWIRTTPNLSIPYFFVDIPICIGFGMICYYVTKDLLLRFLRLVRKSKNFPEQEAGKEANN